MPTHVGGRVLVNLGIAVLEQPTGDKADNIERVIEYCSSALEVLSKDDAPEEWSSANFNLGNAFVHRLRGDRAENIERALFCLENASEIHTKDQNPDQWARIQNSLALSYLQRIKERPANNLEKGKIAAEAALEIIIREDNPEAWATLQNTLGCIYLGRVYGTEAENMERAITALEGALEVWTRDSNPERWATLLHNLGFAFSDRVKGDKDDNLERAIAAYNAALEVRTKENDPEKWAMTNNNLGNAYRGRVKSGRDEFTELAIVALKNALQVYSPSAYPADARKTARNLGNLYFQQENWSEAQIAYDIAIEAGEYLYSTSLTEPGRQRELLENAQVFANNAFCLARTDRLSEAIISLERGRTRVLSELLAQDESRLREEVKEGDRNNFLALSQRLRALSLEQQTQTDLSLLSIADEVRQLRSDLDDLIRQIRSYVPNFMLLELDLSVLKDSPSVNSQTAMLEFNVTSKGTAVFIMRFPHAREEIDVIFIPEFTSEVLEHLVGNYSEDVRSIIEEYNSILDKKAYHSRSDEMRKWLGRIADSRGEYQAGWYFAYRLYQSVSQLDRGSAYVAARDAWFKTVERVASFLGAHLWKAIHIKLREYGTTRLILIPHLSLNVLPLHAAVLENGGLTKHIVDLYEIIYAPSVTVLSQCLQRSQRNSDTRRALLAVSNPTRDLLFAHIEVEAINELFAERTTILDESIATRDNFLSQLGEHNYIHFSGHGSYNWDTPLDSSLRFADEALTLSQVQSQVDLRHVRQVTLSACETGLTNHQDITNEYVGLAAGFLIAGAPTVISSLWAVNDLSTSLVMEHFYQELLNGAAPASALRRAQVWLRNLTAGELVDYFNEHVERLITRERMNTEEALSWRRSYDLEEPESRPFSHPYFWAAFTVTGAGLSPAEKPCGDF